jgi:flagellar basal body rod protein FlgB
MAGLAVLFLDYLPEVNMDPLKLTQPPSSSASATSVASSKSATGQQTAAVFADVLAGLTQAKSSVNPATPKQAAQPTGVNPVFGQFSMLPTFHERALALREYRQELLASNIANADTPGYKAVDIDIKKMIADGVSVDEKIAPQYVLPSQASVDGNTVDMDRERAEFSKNAVMYEYEVDRVKGRYKAMQDLLSNLPY